MQSRVLSFPRFRLFLSTSFIAYKMSTHQANKDKPRAQKCRHFCFSFDTHNFCPTCREAGKGDDPCVTFETPCEVCTSFTDEQLQKIQNRKRYLKKQKATTSSKDELDLLGEGDGDSFTGSNADLECAADSLFISPPRPQPLAFSSLSLKTPAKTVPPTPGTALQNKIQSNLEKSLGDSLNIHLQQQMGSFQASMLEAFRSLREELTVKQKVEAQPSTLASKPGLSSTSAAPLDLPPPRSGTNIPSEDMDVDYGPTLPPRLVSTQPSSDQYVAPSEGHPEEVSYSHKKQSHRQPVDPSSASDQLNEDSDEPRIPSSRPKKHSDRSKHKSRSRYVSFTSEEDHSPVARHRSSKPSRAQPSGVASDQDLPQHDPDPPYYRAVALSDMPSQYSEEVDTFRRILSLPDPRESMPRSSTSVLGLDDEKGRQELRPRGPYSPEPQTPSIRVSYPRPKGLGHRCSEHKLDQPHSICVPSYGSPSQGDPKDQAMPVPDHRNSPRLARDALVLGPSAALNRDPTATPSVNNPTQTVPQVGVPQQPPAPEPPRLVSRSGQLQEQGFSVEVAERIAAPQRSSTRTIYKSKWALFEKWCRENSVDFSTPSVKQISDFFMYLYQDLNRRPSTIDGYRTAIVDTLGPTAQHIAHNADLHRLLSSFHRDRPKSSRNLPKWNLSVVLNELTKAPFEPMKDSDLKHLTLKTAFLLALASGKRRSEIHAWVANKVSNLGQWEKVALFPSSDFIAKNQLAREGSQSVSPVTIPALTTIVDRQFKEDRTLCPVRALRFYLDRTKDLRGSRSLLFISFKKGHTSDIRPATLSSWLKQTILLCYKQADQQALDLVQVKAHDIRAFAASKAFYGGVSVDQIMQACHWKAHNTFTNFYLKDLTWSDTDNNLYLGPVVAAQQVLDPSPQTSCPRKEKRGGGTSATTKSSGVFPRI